MIKKLFLLSGLFVLVAVVGNGVSKSYASTYGQCTYNSGTYNSCAATSSTPTPTPTAKPKGKSKKDTGTGTIATTTETTPSPTFTEGTLPPQNPGSSFGANADSTTPESAGTNWNLVVWSGLALLGSIGLFGWIIYRRLGHHDVASETT